MEPVAPSQTPDIEKVPEITPSSAAPQSHLDTVDPGSLRQIRTFQGDMTEAISHNQSSLISIRAAAKAKQAESDKQKSPEEVESGKERVKSVLYFFFGILFLGAAGYAGWYSYHTYIAKTAVPTVLVPQNRLLPVVATEDIDATNLGRAGIISLLESDRNKPLPDGNVLHIELRKGASVTSNLLSTTEMLVALEAKPPSNLVRAFNPLFMLGTLGETPEAGTSTTFMLIKLDSFENSYAGMLDWEKNIKDDILPLFQTAETVGTVATNYEFQDISIKNKDARALYNTDGKMVLVYSFYNQKLLLITGNESGLKTLLSELDTQALKR